MEVKVPGELKTFVKLDTIEETHEIDDRVKAEQERDTTTHELETKLETLQLKQLPETKLETLLECSVCHKKHRKLSKLTCDDLVCSECVDVNGQICPKCGQGDAL